MYKEIPFSTNLLGYASLGTMIFAVICTSIAMGLPYWEYYDISLGGQQNITYYGLWRYCKFQPETTDLTDMCGDPIDTATGSGKTDVLAVRAMVVIALLLEVDCAVSVILVVFVLKRKFFIHFIAGGSGIAAGLFSMFALAVYNARVRKEDYDLHVSTALDIVAWLVAWTSAGFIIYMGIVKKKDED